VSFVGISKGNFMPELLDLLGILTTGRKPHSVVGWRLGKPVDCEEFLARVRAWRELLRRTSGQAFALNIGDSIEFASALFGTWAAGKMIYLPSDTLPGTCANLRPFVNGFIGEFASEWNPMVPKSQDEKADTDSFAPLQGGFIGLILFTSGSTGTPQPIAKRLFQMSREVTTLEAQFGNLLGAVDVITTVSHQHIYGLLFNVLWPLAAGRAIYAKNFYFPPDLMEVLAERDGLLVSSPAHLKHLPEHPLRAEIANRLRAVFSSGGPLSFEVASNVKRLLGPVPIEVYGSSETGGVAWRQQHSPTDEAWTPMLGVMYRIDSETGVLEVRSPHLPNEEWFRTADCALSLEDNRFLLKGRIDRIVKIEGKRISLAAIERQLTASSVVADARAVVMEGRRPRIAAFVVPSVCGRSKLAEVGELMFNRMLRDALSQSIDPVGIPRVWRYLDALPTNAQGKTTYASLIALLDGKPSRSTLPLQRLVERNTRRAVVELAAPGDLFYFNGHFPGMPILAGVVQIDWVIACGRQCFDLPPVFLGIHALKFQRIIIPENPFRVELAHEPATSCLSFKITSRVGTHTSGTLMFGESVV
jgi:acyl-CoA synthetase (AMP-forming)/AMP-acid ligase II/3-hydroxymyristoyl/3-hydroxydecanoyl-(acyl carrier protein) dehydratase